MRVLIAAVISGAMVLGLRPARAELVPVAAPAVGADCDDIDLAPLVAALVAEINVLQSKSAPMKFGGQQITPLDYSNRTLRPLYELAKAGDKPCALCGADQQVYLAESRRGAHLVHRLPHPHRAWLSRR